MKYYIYFHFRLDTNQVFYIGKGCGNRLNQKTNRNKHWYNIVNKVGYRAEKIFIDLTEEQAFELEKKYIAIYKDLLCNLTDGGDQPPSQLGKKQSKETIEKRIGKVKGRKNTEESKKK